MFSDLRPVTLDFFVCFPWRIHGTIVYLPTFFSIIQAIHVGIYTSHMDPMGLVTCVRLQTFFWGGILNKRHKGGLSKRMVANSPTTTGLWITFHVKWWLNVIGQMLFQHDFLLVSIFFPHLAPTTNHLHLHGGPRNLRSWRWPCSTADSRCGTEELRRPGTEPWNKWSTWSSSRVAAPCWGCCFLVKKQQHWDWTKIWKGRVGEGIWIWWGFWEKFVASLTGWLNLFGLIEWMTWREGDITCPSVSPIRIYIYGW